MSEFKYQTTGTIKVKENLEAWILRTYNLASLDYFSNTLISDFIDKISKLKIRPFKNTSGHNYNYFTDIKQSGEIIYDRTGIKYGGTTLSDGTDYRGNGIKYSELYIYQDENTVEAYNEKLKDIDSDIQLMYQKIEEKKKEAESINDLISFMKERNIKELDKEEYQIWKKLNSYAKQAEMILEAEKEELNMVPKQFKEKKDITLDDVIF